MYLLFSTSIHSTIFTPLPTTTISLAPFVGERAHSATARASRPRRAVRLTSPHLADMAHVVR